MTTAGTHQEISLKDERLDIDQLDHYLLSFFVGTQSCDIAIFDERKKRLLLLESHTIDSGRSLLENLKDIHQKHALISAGFWKRVEVTLRNHRFCQVPNALYSAEHAYDYLKLNAPVEPLNEKYLSLLDKKQGCTTVFSVPNELTRWFDGKYPKPPISYKHESASYISLAGKYASNVPGNHLYVNLTDTDMQVAGFASGKLAIYNTFGIKTPDRAAKLLLVTIQQFSTEGQSTAITLWGRDHQVKAHLPLLNKYYKHLKVGDRPKDVKLNYLFDELDDHEYFEVIGSYL